MTGRIALTGAIFKKVLELNLTTIGQVSIGKIVNLAGYDVQRLDKVCRRIYITSVMYICIFYVYLLYVCSGLQYHIPDIYPVSPRFFLQAFHFTIYFILTPIHVIAVTLVLWLYIGLGPSSLAGMGVVLMQIPVLYFIGQLYAKLRWDAGASLWRLHACCVVNVITSYINCVVTWFWLQGHYVEDLEDYILLPNYI